MFSGFRRAYHAAQVVKLAIVDAVFAQCARALCQRRHADDSSKRTAPASDHFWVPRPLLRQM
jgi:hypothetical protein